MGHPKTKTPIDLHSKEQREAGVLTTKRGETISISAEGSMQDVLTCFANTAFYIAGKLEHDFHRPVSAYEALIFSLNMNARTDNVNQVIQ